MRRKKASGESWSYRDADGTLSARKSRRWTAWAFTCPGQGGLPVQPVDERHPRACGGWARSSWWCPPWRAKRAAAGGRLCGGRDARLFHRRCARLAAALAYGTATVPRVDKITGPGNAYVASAKRRVFGQVGIDMIAGPSEIWCWPTAARPRLGAMDLFSQAEHDELAQSILLCPDATYIDHVQAEIDRLLAQMPRAAIIATSLNDRGMLIHTRDMQQALRAEQPHRPEHLEISSAQPERWSRCCAMRARSSWALTPARAWATTALAPTMCCPPAARRALARPGCTTFKSAPA